MAVLVPAGARPPQSLAEVIAALREFRKGRRLRGLSLRAMICQGRR